jgi:mono/diheme cytochrome c family protein
MDIMSARLVVVASFAALAAGGGAMAHQLVERDLPAQTAQPTQFATGTADLLLLPATASLVAPSAGAAARRAAQDPGRAVFEGKGNCATCHAKDGKGTPLGPDLTDGEWINIGGKPEEIVAVIRTGVMKPKRYPAPMPPMGGARLRDAEIEAVARYVAELARRDGAADPPPQVRRSPTF